MINSIQTFKNVNEPDELKRDFKGIWVTKNLYLDKNLTPVEKLLIIETKNYMDTSCNGHISNEHYVNILNVSTSTVTRSIKRLASKKYITVSIVKTEYGSIRKIHLLDKCLL